MGLKPIRVEFRFSAGPISARACKYGSTTTNSKPKLAFSLFVAVSRSVNLVPVNIYVKKYFVLFLNLRVFSFFVFFLTFACFSI